MFIKIEMDSDIPIYTQLANELNRGDRQRIPSTW